MNSEGLQYAVNIIMAEMHHVCSVKFSKAVSLLLVLQSLSFNYSDCFNYICNLLIKIDFLFRH